MLGGCTAGELGSFGPPAERDAGPPVAADASAPGLDAQMPEGFPDMGPAEPVADAGAPDEELDLGPPAIDMGGPAGPVGHLLPFECGAEVRVSQGNWSSFSHTGKAAWAFDFAVGLNTPILATEAGRVALAKNDVGPGDPCYNGGGSECANSANYVVLDHGDGTATLYLHLNEALVSVGQEVARGERIGLSGTTGWSTAPHVHFQRQQLCSSWWCQSVEVMFADVMGDTPMVDDWVLSGNGC